MRPTPFLPLLVTFALLAAALTAHAGPMKAVLDCSEQKGKLLDLHFTRYPQKPQTIFRQDDLPGVRFWLPPEAKDIGQTMLYSKFVVAGNFEISMTYDGYSVEPPKSGYGVSVGIAVDTENADGKPGIRVSLARGSFVGRGDGYAVTVGTLKTKKGERGIDYKETNFETDRSKKGKIALKRVRDKLICLTGDPAAPIDDLNEIAKIKFTDSTVKKVRIYADQGGSPTQLDVYVSDLLVRAEEITYQIPARDQPGWFWWLIGGITFLIASVIATIVYRRRGNQS
jgi:hypothetical protein